MNPALIFFRKGEIYMEEKVLSLILDKLESIDKRLDSMESNFNGRFEAIENRLDSIESRLDSVESRLGKVESDLKKVNITLENQILPMFDEEREVYKSTFERYLSNNRDIAMFLQCDLPILQLTVSNNTREIEKLKKAVGN